MKETLWNVLVGALVGSILMGTIYSSLLKSEREHSKEVEGQLKQANASCSKMFTDQNGDVIILEYIKE